MGGPPVLLMCTGWSRRPLLPVWCIARVTRMLGPVSSYTCVVWGRWRVTVILAASLLRVVVWGMM